MLFEDFINRHKDNRTADIVFPHIIFPILMIIGSFLVLLIPFLFMMRNQLFNAPNLGFACIMTGGGLIAGSIGIGATWGLIKEKKSGYRRSNYEFLMLRNIFLLALVWPWPFFYGALFFYHYPLQTYQTYIFEMKPTPEVKKEIERLNFFEIKSHTPYDYSLEHQTIRYDFMDKIEYASFMSKKGILLYTIETKEDPNEHSEKIQQFTRKLDLSHDYYPTPIKYSDLKTGYLCTLKVHYKNTPHTNPILINEDVTLTPLKFNGNVVFYDFSLIFYDSGPREKNKTCVLRTLDSEKKENLALLKFWAFNLYLPNTHKNVTDIKIEHRQQLDFRWKRFMHAIKQF